MQTLDVSAMGIRLRLITPDPDVLAFVAAFGGLAADQPDGGEPQIIVTLAYGEPRVDDGDLRKVSRDMWIGPSKVFIAAFERFPGLSLVARQHDSVLHLQAFVRRGRRTLAERIMTLRKESTRARQLFSLLFMYYLINFPLWYYAEHYRAVSLLHAGALQWQGKGIVLAGLGGIGKTTFAVSALMSGKARFLSDNLVFYDTRSLYPVPEPVALDVRRGRGLGPLVEYLVPVNVDSTHGRMYFHVKKQFCIPAVEPVVLVWLQSGRENRMTAMDRALCARHAAHINLLARELREYYLFSAAFDLAFESPLAPETRYSRLGALLAGLECYSLQFKPGDDVARVLQETVGRVLA
jgi:hypothetical protein